MWLVVTEVIGHAVLAVGLLGWSSGFQYCLVPLVPFVMFNERLRGTFSLAVSTVVLMVFVALYELRDRPKRSRPPTPCRFAQLAPGLARWGGYGYAT